MSFTSALPGWWGLGPHSASSAKPQGLARPALRCDTLAPVKLATLRLFCPETLGKLELSFLNEQAAPRSVTLIYGAPGTGKTTLLRAIGSTRPGYAVACSLRPSDAPCFAATEWLLGLDEPDRLHPLRLASPNAPEDFAQLAITDRREAVLFERLAKEGGFVFLFFSALRWFSKSALTLSSPERSLARYDVRAFEPVDDATRSDLARDTKQALAYAAISASLPHGSFEGPNHTVLGTAMQETVDSVARIHDYRYLGLEPRSFEPYFLAPGGKQTAFDHLPTQLKHAIAIPALLVRALWGAYPNLKPNTAQGVVALDQPELHQDDAGVVSLVEALVDLFPNVQWICTTRSAALLASRDAGDIIALRRPDAAGSVQVDLGEAARLH